MSSSVQTYSHRKAIIEQLRNQFIAEYLVQNMDDFSAWLKTTVPDYELRAACLHFISNVDADLVRAQLLVEAGKLTKSRRSLKEQGKLDAQLAVIQGEFETEHPLGRFNKPQKPTVGVGD